ncbi:DegT/DnrJ/EryC1/StrS family aminotransferase [Aquirufa sp. OSTEICH-129A]
MQIEMVDLKGQYIKIKNEIDQAVISCMASASFINGPAVKEFQLKLEQYLGVKHVIPCANGTDSLQIAMMALDLKPGDEVICPAFTYVATAEVIGLLGLTPVMVDVDPDTFNLTASAIEKAITSKTKAIVPVHLYGQSCDMEPIMKLAEKHNLYVIEDNAQAIGADYTYSNGSVAKTGTIGHIGSTSFFPSKNLGCYGDGGALMTNNDELANKMRMIANHGQEKKYHHKILGCNSRLDTIQATILNIKLCYLDKYNSDRNAMATFYDEALSTVDELEVPARQINSSHVFHQYTLKVKNSKRNKLQQYLSENGIPSMIYYPLPLYKQEAFQQFVTREFSLATSERLCDEVLSLPIHTEMNIEHLNFICNTIKSFFN